MSQPRGERVWNLAARLYILAWLLLVTVMFTAPTAKGQTTGGRFTEEEITTIGATQAQAAVDAIPEPGNAFLWQNQPAGVPIVMPADDSVLTHWTTADGSSNFQLGVDTNPTLNDGDRIIITRAGRYLLLANVTVTANPAVNFDVYISKDKKKIPGVNMTADGTIGTKHQVTVSAFADIALSQTIRVSFSSSTGGTLTIYDVSLVAYWIGPELSP